VISLIADLIVSIHFLWIIFLVFGFYFVLKGSRMAYVHASGLLFSLVLNLMGWYCPLTHLEDHFKRPGTPVKGSFMARNLEKVIYPDLDESWIRKGGIVFVVLNGTAYAWAFRRRFKDKAQGTKD
jgi:hypothetical protein